MNTFEKKGSSKFAFLTFNPATIKFVKFFYLIFIEKKKKQGAFIHIKNLLWTSKEINKLYLRMIKHK